MRICSIKGSCMMTAGQRRAMLAPSPRYNPAGPSIFMVFSAQSDIPVYKSGAAITLDLIKSIGAQTMEAVTPEITEAARCNPMPSAFSNPVLLTDSFPYSGAWRLTFQGRCKSIESPHTHLIIADGQPSRDECRSPHCWLPTTKQARKTVCSDD
eukprot:SAG31_NODE_1752_length_7351_cov_29.035852_1_plen_154_part_00